MIPLAIGLIFLIALVVVIATTAMLRKDLVHEGSLQLAGNFKDRLVRLLSALKLAKNAMSEPTWNGKRRCIRA